MESQEVTKAEKSAKTQAFSKNSVKHKNKCDGRVARGAGFEPARPLRTTGLAGLDSSKRG